MVHAAIVECSFLIPVRRDAILSDGELHSLESWNWLEAELFAEFKGGTLAPGLYQGFYADPDTQSRVNDQSRKYMVAVPSADLARLRELLSKACVEFKQKCIYLSVAGQVEFIEADDHEPKQDVH
jgi:hypothetical protein